MGDLFGTRPWEMLDLTPIELEQMLLYIDAKLESGSPPRRFGE